MKIYYKGLIGFILIIIIFTSCSTKSGDKFLGKWKSTGTLQNHIIIKKNGDNFIIKSENIYQGIYILTKEGNLRAEILGEGTITFMFDEENKQLLDNLLNEHWKRE